tara:strand:- start:392 stop:652 length:261 start_codon:yes stop_codon:yes gene_type:complete
MIRKEIEEWLSPCGEDVLFATGFDDAIVGVSEVDGRYRVCYDIGRILELLVSEHDMDEEGALEYFDFNIAGAYVGPLTPIFVQCVL